MIFPRDINKRIANKRKLAGDNKVQLVITLVVLGNFGGFILAGWINRMLFSGGLLTTLLILFIFNVIIGISVFRFFIFDENAKIHEFKSTENDSFSKFVKVRKDVEHTLKTADTTVNAAEYANGSLAFTLELKFGSNDDALASSTRGLLQELLQIAHSAKFETRCCVMSENFERSGEYKHHVDALNKVSSQVLRNALIRISEAIMEEHHKKGNASCIYLTVHSLTNYQRAELEDILKSYLKVFEENVTAFRSIRFLSIEELVQFFVEFYGVSTIDLATAHAIDLANSIDDDFRSIVKLVSLQATDGSTFVANNFKDKAFRLEEKVVR